MEMELEHGSGEMVYKVGTIVYVERRERKFFKKAMPDNGGPGIVTEVNLDKDGSPTYNIKYNCISAYRSEKGVLHRHVKLQKQFSQSRSEAREEVRKRRLLKGKANLPAKKRRLIENVPKDMAPKSTVTTMKVPNVHQEEEPAVEAVAASPESVVGTSTVGIGVPTVVREEESAGATSVEAVATSPVSVVGTSTVGIGVTTVVQEEEPTGATLVVREVLTRMIEESGGDEFKLTDLKKELAEHPHPPLTTELESILRTMDDMNVILYSKDVIYVI